MIIEGNEQQDEEDIILAHTYRLSLASSPRQSSFRVVAVIFYELNSVNDDDKSTGMSMRMSTSTCTSTSSNRLHVVGSNDEPCYIGGSICAERAALVQLRFIPNLTQITKVVISTDASHPLHPGMLCREFMSSHPAIDPQRLQIVMAGSICNRCGLDITLAKECHSNKVEYHPCLEGKHRLHEWDIIRTNLLEIYPFPSLYTRLTASESVIFGKRNGLSNNNNNDNNNDHNNNNNNTEESEDKLSKLANNDRQLIKQAINAACEGDDRNSLHPITYGAAIRMSDETVFTSCQRKTLEYGCTVDAVIQFAPFLSEKAKKNIHPVILVQADNFGLLHPPFATARAFLSEYGYGECIVLTMKRCTNNEVQLDRVSIKDLAPYSPNMGDLWKSKE